MRRLVVSLLFTAAAVGVPAVAWADVTAFWGFSPTVATRPSRGFGFGLSLLVVGFEIEYGNTAEDLSKAAPSVTTGMINGLVQTPTSTQLYLTAGGGFYRERVGALQETNFGTNIGGGAKIGIAGPLRLRLDYRVFRLRGTPAQQTSQRFYAGVNFSF